MTFTLRHACAAMCGTAMMFCVSCSMGRSASQIDGASAPSSHIKVNSEAEPGLGIMEPEHGIAEFVEYAHHQTDIGLQHPDVGSKEVIVFWGDLEPEEGRYAWEKMDRLFDAWERAGKQIRIRLSTAHDGPFYTPDWVMHRHGIRSIAKGTWVDFESTVPAGFTWSDAAAITDSPARLVGGAKSLRIDREDGGTAAVLTYRPQAGFTSGVTYLFDFDYVLGGPAIQGRARFVDHAGAEVASEPFVLGATSRDSCCLRLRSPDKRAVAMELLVDGPAKGSLDNILVAPLVRNPAWRVIKPDADEPEWELSGGAEWVTDERGRRAIRLAKQGAAVSTHPVNAPLVIGESYQSFYGFRRIKESRIIHRLTDGSTDFAQQIFSVTKSEGERGVWFERNAWKPNQKIEIRMDNDGEMLIYDVGWRCISDQITVFPDYFSPRFAREWAKFVGAFAQRYGKRSALATVTVGGFGRWEEVMLDAGGVDAQWLARGYTLDAYLKRIEDCMRLYRELLPAHPLQICLAHGIKRDGPQAKQTYWNVGRMASEHHVGLKQNGLSEKYNAFGQGTASNDVTVLYNWCHGTPGMGFAYETGAQIYNNAYNCHGHPISLLNRALIDGVNTLLLYENDVSQPTINQFFMPFVAQAGRPAPTMFYNQVGRFPLRHPRFGIQDYQHLWLGVRHHTGKGTDPELTAREGRQCLSTREGNRRIAWDINAEAMYHGMYGVALSVEYLDSGTDSFVINVLNKLTGTWEVLARVQKAGTGKWKTAKFASPILCAENRSGPNEMADFVIDDLGDGYESVSRVEIQHVPARGWRQRTLLDTAPDGSHRTGPALAIPTTDIKSGESACVRAFNVAAGQVVTGVAVQFADIDRSDITVGARVRVFSSDGGEALADKRVLNPSPGRWYMVPVMPRTGVSAYRVQLDGRSGGIAAAAGQDGGLALRVVSAQTEPTATIWTVAEGTATITVPAPFIGLRLTGSGDLGSAKVTVRKLLDADGGHMAEAFTATPVQEVSGSYSVYGEPQTGGRYQVEIAGARGVAVQALLLQQAFTPRPAAEHRLPAAIVSVGRAADAGGGAVEWVLPAALPADARQVLRFDVANTTASSLARLEWWREGGAAPEVTFVPLVPWDTGMRRHHLNVGLFPEWSGAITRIRLTPALSLDDGGTITGGPASVHIVDHKDD